MKIDDYHKRQKEDPRWAGAGGYRDHVNSFPFDMTVYIMRSIATKAIVGRFTGPNVWFQVEDALKYLNHRRFYKQPYHPTGYVEDEVVEVRMVEVSVVRNEQQKNAARRQAFRAGNMDGRWSSPQIEEFFNHMVKMRASQWAERKALVDQANGYPMRPGQTASNEELLVREFAYIDKMLEDCYVEHFTLAIETAQGAWPLGRRFDHKYEPGAEGVCYRCGVEGKDHGA